MASVKYLAYIMLRTFSKPIECKCNVFGWPAGGLTSMCSEWKTDLDTLFKDSSEDQLT